MQRPQQRPPASSHNSAAASARTVQWREHEDPSGRTYISNTSTGATRWLWSRHRDTKTNRDYIANFLTGERQWVTAQNQHLCPVPKGPPESTATASPPKQTRAGAGGRKVGAKSATAKLAASMAIARQKCGPNEEPIRNQISGRIDIRNRVTGAIRTIFEPTPGGPPAAVLLLQRTYRMRAVHSTEIGDKLRALRTSLANVEAFVSSGKYDLNQLCHIASTASTVDIVKRKKAAELLLQLGEVITQAMLKVDGIESQGNEVIRNVRKRCVKRLLKLTDMVEDAREKLTAQLSKA